MRGWPSHFEEKNFLSLRNHRENASTEICNFELGLSLLNSRCYTFNDAPIRTLMLPGFPPVKTSQNGLLTDHKAEAEPDATDLIGSHITLSPNSKQYGKIP